MANDDLVLLDRHERSRAAAFVRSEDRTRYVFAHAVLRRVLGVELGCQAASVRFRRMPCPGCGELHGRPALSDAPGGPEFSLSHGGGYVAVALASSVVGVDVEPLPRKSTLSDVVEMLHPRERQEIQLARTSGQAAAFARIWTRKEAYLKALGTGLSRNLALDDTTAQIPGWHLADVSVPSGYAAAVAVADGTAAGTARSSGLSSLSNRSSRFEASSNVS